MQPAPEVTSLERISVAPEDGKAVSPAEFARSFDSRTVTTQPGCYIMRGEGDKVLYVGKAKSLRARIRAYLNETDSRYMVKFLMQRVAHIDFLITSNEKEALLLENSLIKQHRPRYNVHLKDDKTYVSLRFPIKDDFPRLGVVRKFKKDGAMYFGPYSSAGSVRQTLRQIQRIFPLRTCTDAVMNNRARPCLYYQMKQCSAPCVGLINRAAYHEIADEVVMLLQGKNDELEKHFLDRIAQRVERLEFEDAASLRDRLFALKRTLERQRTVDVKPGDDRDIFGVYTQNRFVEVQVIFYRGGKMLGGRSFSFKQHEVPIEESFGSFLLQFYAAAPVVPAEILIPFVLEEAESLCEILSEQREGTVVLHCPQRGDKRALVELAARNAKNSFEEKKLAVKSNEDLLEQVKEKLFLSRTPQRIECFDISTTQGEKAVASMAVFEGGVASKQRYRHYAIRHVDGQDDFAMMREVLMRRYTRGIEEGDLPDLVLVDGGKGQLGVATTVLSDLGIEDIPAVGIAKSRAQEDGTHSPERFFIPNRANPIVLAQNSPIVLLLARIRDEAHRFANTYHRKRQRQGLTRSALTSIPDIGPKRAAALLKALGSIVRIARSEVDDIAAVPGFNPELAQRVKDYLTGKSNRR